MLLYVPKTLTLRNYTFCPQSAGKCFVGITEPTVIICLNSIKRLVFVIQTHCVLYYVRIGFQFTIVHNDGLYLNNTDKFSCLCHSSRRKLQNISNANSNLSSLSDLYSWCTVLWFHFVQSGHHGIAFRTGKAPTSDGSAAWRLHETDIPWQASSSPDTQKIHPHCTEPGGSWPLSQQPVTCPNRKADQSRRHPLLLFPLRSILILLWT